MPLLPPKVVGPINELSRQITVVGTGPGATVQLFANGISFGPSTIGSGPSVAVPLGAVRAVAGQAITATQSLDSETSDSSPGEAVSAAPAELPPVVFLSQVHTAIDWVVIGGLVPGVTVTVTHRGDVVGQQVATSMSLSIRVKFAQPFNQGDVLVASQNVAGLGGATIQGRRVESLPAEGRDLKRPPLPPNIMQPLRECDTAVRVTDIEQGATTRITLSDLPFEGLEAGFVAPTVNIGVRRLPFPGTVTVSQAFANRSLEGPDGPAVPVTHIPPDPPRVLEPICPDANTVKVTGLRPGTEVALDVNLEFIDGISGILSINLLRLGSGWAWSEDCEFSLPKDGLSKAIQALQALRPPGTPGKFRLFMLATATPCNQRAVQSNQASIEPLPVAAGPPFIVGPLFACGRLVHVLTNGPGSILTLHSDAPDATQMSDPQRVSSSESFLSCYRPLRAGEKISATMSGCGNSSIGSRAVQVGAAPALKPPVVIPPVRPFDRGAKIEKVVPGARVYVFVNGLWRASVDSFSENVFVALGALNIKDEITALQVLCDKTSALSQGVPVTIGRLSVHHDPSPLVRVGAGKFTLFAIRVQDAVTAFQVNARAFINNVEFPIDRELGTVIPLGQDGPPTFVQADGYANEPLVYKLIDPPVPAPAFLTLDFASNTPGTSIDKVTWDLYSTSGLGNSQRTKIFTKTGATAQFQLPPPAGANTEYLVECSADVKVPNSGNMTVNIGGASNGFEHSAAVGWVGQNLAAHFRLQFDLGTDPNTGQPVVFVSIKLTGTTP